MNNKVAVFCKNTHSFREYPQGTSLLEIYNDMDVRLPYRVLAARVNYKVESLNFRIYKPKNIEFIDASSPSGQRVYLRTVTMIMAKALSELMPDAVLRVEHPICRGYYCCINNREEKVSADLIGLLKARMYDIIRADKEIEVDEQQTSVVIEMFRRRGMNDKVALLETLGFPYTRFYRIDDYIDYYDSMLAPTTGYIDLFGLEPYENGFILRIADIHSPDRITSYLNQDKLFGVFNEFVGWNKLMGVPNVGDFNRINNPDSIAALVKVSEALQEKKIAQIADMIKQRQPGCDFVMISGPSSSGKTTFAKRLGIQLMVVGIKPVVLSLDNYFVERDNTPRDACGDYDYEHLQALDIQLLNEHLVRLMKGEEIECPYYCFDDGRRYYRGEKMRLGPDSVLVMEGIHALNPDMCPSVPQDSMFKIYVSALTTISIDNHNWIPTSDTRLIRRIIRDNQFRSSSARNTIARWPSVRRGEERWIFPFQENADVMFNSAFLFELAVFRPYAEYLLMQVPQYCEEYTEAHRLLKFLKHFTPVNDRDIPATSLLREFLGGSSFK
ncbi:MAG: nucleoside kinase [Candidatus Aphodosoma sp.]